MNRFLASSLMVLALFLAACATPTRVDYERNAIGTMQAYQSFAIDSREARSGYQDVVLSPIVDRRIERAITSNLLEKDFKLSDAPDFRVSFNTVTKTRTELNDYSPPTFRRAPYYGYGGRYLDLDQYEEGTFIIDIIDATSKQLVWRGAYVKRLGWSAPDEAEVQEIVRAILSDFPPGTVSKN